MKNKLHIQWGDAYVEHAVQRRAVFDLFSMNHNSPLPIKTNPIMQQVIKEVHTLGYTDRHPLYHDKCLEIYNKLTKESSDNASV